MFCTWSHFLLISSLSLLPVAFPQETPQLPNTDLFLFTHAVAPSHLTLVFDVAEAHSNRGDVYDIRWPAVQAVADHPLREGFKAIFYDTALTQAERMKRVIDSSAMDRSGSNMAMFEMLFSALGILLKPCEHLDDVLAKINSRRHTASVNLSISDVFSVHCSVAIARALNSPVVFVSPVVEPSSTQALTAGPLLPSYVVSVMQATPPIMNFLQRSGNVLAHGLFRMFFLQLPLASLWFGDKRPYYDMPGESVVLVNNHRFLDFPSPRTNAHIDIGHREMTSFLLEQQISDFTDRYDHIVILSMSTYSNDGVFPPPLQKIFFSAFRRLSRVGFIWRLKLASPNALDVSSPNVLLVNTIDQTTLLGHPKTKVLISHCGQNSVLEAFAAGVPILGIPTSGDQFPNAERIKLLETGIILNLRDLDAQDVTTALSKLLPDPQTSTYALNAQKVKSMLEMDKQLVGGQKPFLKHAVAWSQKVTTEKKLLKTFVLPKSTLLTYAEYFYLDHAITILLLTCLFLV